jgi:pyruvyltransferase
MGLVQQLYSRLKPAAPASVEPPYPEVNLFSWAPKNGQRNFGDHLSKVIVQAVAGEYGLTLEDEVRQPKRMLAIGSIAHFAQDGDVLWGTGVNGKIDLARITARNIDVRAVRGPKTAAVLKDLGVPVPAIYGDPGLLVPRYFGERFQRTASRDYIIVPNLHDLSLVADRPETVSPLLGWNVVVEAITSSKFVVSSSLHGIVIAEAFGIPARYVRLSETESRFKYDDYAQGTGRFELAPASSVDEALAMGGHEPIAFDVDALVNAFPRDLWMR